MLVRVLFLTLHSTQTRVQFPANIESHLLGLVFRLRRDFIEWASGGIFFYFLPHPPPPLF